MDNTIESLHNDMLSDIPDEYDKSEGSFFYDALKPVAIELTKSNDMLALILPSAFSITATGDDLTNKCIEQGIIRKKATKSCGIVTLTGISGANIIKGEIVASDNVNFKFTENLVIPATGSINANVECEIDGIKGNVPVGAIKYFPKTLQGIYTCTNGFAFTNGYEAEDDESLRQRYFEKINTPSTSGNKYHYIQWAKEVDGVGDAKCFPLWNGNGTVKVTIIDRNGRAATSDLVSATKTYIEENRPIGANVTITSATEKLITISASVKLANGFSTLQIKSLFEEAVREYFKQISFKTSYVSYAKIGSILYSLPGVGDYSDLKVNSGVTNILLNEEEIPVLNTITLGVL